MSLELIVLETVIRDTGKVFQSLSSWIKKINIVNGHLDNKNSPFSQMM
jgi:hypothetical protein